MTNPDKREYIALTAMKLATGWDATMRGAALIRALAALLTEEQLAKLDVEALMRADRRPA